MEIVDQLLDWKVWLSQLHKASKCQMVLRNFLSSSLDIWLRTWRPNNNGHRHHKGWTMGARAHHHRQVQSRHTWRHSGQWRTIKDAMGSPGESSRLALPREISTKGARVKPLLCTNDLLQDRSLRIQRSRTKRGPKYRRKDNIVALYVNEGSEKRRCTPWEVQVTQSFVNIAKIEVKTKGRSSVLLCTTKYSTKYHWQKWLFYKIDL